MRVLIADEHRLFRQGLRALLESRGIEVVGEAPTGLAAVEQARRTQPDIVLLDIVISDGDGLEIIRTLSEELPEAAVVVLTEDDDEKTFLDAIRSGAEGYLLKDLDADRFVRMLEGVCRGELALMPHLARRMLDELAVARRSASKDSEAAMLTPREKDVLRLLVSGVTTTRALAKRLDVSANTVKFHLRNIFDKLHLTNRAEIVGYALRHRLVEPSAGTRS